MKNKPPSITMWCVTIAMLFLPYCCLSLLPSVSSMIWNKESSSLFGLNTHQAIIVHNFLSTNGLIVKDNNTPDNVQFTHQHTLRSSKAACALVGARRLPKIVSVSTFMTKGPYRCRPSTSLTA